MGWGPLPDCKHHQRGLELCRGVQLPSPQQAPVRGGGTTTPSLHAGPREGGKPGSVAALTCPRPSLLPRRLQLRRGEHTWGKSRGRGGLNRGGGVGNGLRSSPALLALTDTQSPTAPGGGEASPGGKRRRRGRRPGGPPRPGGGCLPPALPMGLNFPLKPLVGRGCPVELQCSPERGSHPPRFPVPLPQQQQLGKSRGDAPPSCCPPLLPLRPKSLLVSILSRGRGYLVGFLSLITFLFFQVPLFPPLKSAHMNETPPRKVCWLSERTNTSPHTHPLNRRR